MVRRPLLLASLALVCGLGWALAQPFTSFSNNTTVKGTTGFGSIIDIPIRQVQNGLGVTTVATGTTVASTGLNTQAYLLAIGAITTWTATLPNPAYDGSLWCIANGTGSNFTTNTTVTALTTPQNQTLSQAFSGATVNAGASVCWVYIESTLTWFRVQ